MWGLEYAYLFGLPNNKLELIDGRSRCVFPFRDRHEAEAHFADWIDTLCRWKKVERPPITHTKETQLAEAAGFSFELERTAGWRSG